MEKLTQRFCFNLDTKKYTVEDLEGRPHFVVPAAIIGDDQVIHGSAGAFLYPGNENQKDPTIWNGMPAVIYHPKMGDEYISARDPTVYNERKVGSIFRTIHNTGKVRTMLYVDQERVKEVDQRVYDAIVNGTPLEVSTGLKCDSDMIPGEKDGKPYMGKVRNYQPDHLAILPDKTGAYSVAMGGGTLANEAPMQEKRSKADLDLLPLALFGDPVQRRYPIQNQEDVDHAASLLHHAGDPTAVKKRVTAIVRHTEGLKLPDSWVFSINEMSFSDISYALEKKLGETYGEKGQRWRGWVSDVYGTYCVFYMEDKLYRVEYTLSEGNVTLQGSPVEVVRTTDYQPVSNNSGASNEVPQEDATMAFDKNAHVNALIQNGVYAEKDRVALMATNDAILEGIKVPTPAPVIPAAIPPASTVPVTPTNGRMVTINDLDPAIRKQVERGLTADAKLKENYANAIMANQNNTFTKDFLLTKDPEELEGMLRLMTPGNVTVGNDGRFLPGYQPNGVGYQGIQGGVGLLGNAGPTQPPPGPVLEAGIDPFPVKS